MTGASLRTALRHLHRLASPGGDPGLTDGQLLERFARRHDEAAFEALLWRHAPLVYGVCRRILGRRQDVEDAFQATFLTLVRKARSVRSGEALPGWLYQVARRVALRAREGARRRATLEGVDVPAAAPDDVERRDLCAAVEEEVSRLPAKYRQAVVLCYLGGHTTHEAARRLGCARGTVLSRLAWARERLRRRLTKRGLAPAGVAVLAMLREASAGVPRALVNEGARSALALAAGKVPAGAGAARAVALMEGVVRSMWLTKLRTALAVLAGVAILGAGAALWSQLPASAGDGKAQAARPAADGARERDRLPARPLGEWEREVEGYHIRLRFEADRVVGTFTLAEEGKTFTASVRADYGVTRDSVLYGVVTSVEVAGKDEDAAKEGLDALEFIDEPFSVHFRLDDNLLVLKHFKFMGKDLREARNDDLLLLEGPYRRKGSGKDRDR